MATSVFLFHEDPRFPEVYEWESWDVSFDAACYRSQPSSLASASTPRQQLLPIPSSLLADTVGGLIWGLSPTVAVVSGDSDGRASYSAAANHYIPHP